MTDPQGWVTSAPAFFNELGVAVFQSERVGQQLDDARVHAGQDGQFAAGVFVGEIFFVFARFDKILVIGENFTQFAHGVGPPTKWDDYSGFRAVWLCSGVPCGCG